MVIKTVLMGISVLVSCSGFIEVSQACPSVRLDLIGRAKGLALLLCLASSGSFLMQMKQTDRLPGCGQTFCPGVSQQDSPR